MSKFDIGSLNEEEKGYIIGLFVGDGSFNRGNKEKRFFVRFALDGKKDKDVATKIADIMGKAWKKISLYPWKSNIIAKVCSKELVNYIQCKVQYRPDGKNLVAINAWTSNFKYGFIAGLIDSDGHVHEHLGTEIKTVSCQISSNVKDILNELKISANTKSREAHKNSFSKKPRFEIYVPSAEMKATQRQDSFRKDCSLLSHTDFFRERLIN